MELLDSWRELGRRPANTLWFALGRSGSVTARGGEGQEGEDRVRDKLREEGETKQRVSEGSKKRNKERKSKKKNEGAAGKGWTWRESTTIIAVNHHLHSFVSYLLPSNFSFLSMDA